MPSALRRWTLVLGRWPRRLAAVACLLLAAGSALSHRPATAAGSAHPAATNAIADALPTGEVAVPVTLARTGAGFVHRDDHIGLYASPAAGDAGDTQLVADGLRVLSVSTDTGTDGASIVIVAADRGTALRIAAVSQSTLLAVLDKPA
jgi:hypothetical protein